MHGSGPRFLKRDQGSPSAGCSAKAPLAGSPAVGVAAGSPAPQATAGGPALPAPRVPYPCQDGRQGQAKAPAKKKNKRGTRSKAATERRINKGQAHRLASALDRAEAEEAGTPGAQGSAEARGRRVVVTYTAQEAVEKRAAQTPATEPQKGKKLHKRRKRRSHNPRVVLKSVPAKRLIRLQSVQRSAVRLKSVTRPKRKAPNKLEGQALERAAREWRSSKGSSRSFQEDP